MLSRIKTLFFLLLLFLFVFSSDAFGANYEQLFSENFEASTASWSIYNSSSSSGWSLTSYPDANYNTIYGVDITSRNRRTWASTGEYSWSDYSFEVDILAEAGEDKNIAFRVQSESVEDFIRGYGLHIASPNLGKVFLEKHEGNGVGIDISSTDFNFQNNVWYRVRVEAVGPEIKVFINDSAIINYVDNQGILGEPILNGRISLVGTTGATIPTRIRYDNIEVRKLSVLEVPFFFQDDLPWGDDNYDHIGPTYTMDSSGCYISAAAMVMHYHGIKEIEDPVSGNLVDLDPGTLNTWMAAQKDGYICDKEGNCGLVWGNAIARWTKEYHDLRVAQGLDPTTKLDFSSVYVATDSSELLDEHLGEGNPQIVKLYSQWGSHFVVAKGTFEGKYQINDPENLETELSSDGSYGAKFYGIRSLVPTNTNLSGLLLFVDKDSNLLVKDSNGNLLGQDGEGNTYSQIANGFFEVEELYADIDGQTNPGADKGVKMIWIEDPQSGDYTVQVFGDEDVVEVHQWSYDQAAEVQQQTYAVPLEEGESEPVPFNYNQETGESEVEVPEEEEVSFGSVIEKIKTGVDNGSIKNSRQARRWVIALELAEWFEGRNRKIASAALLQILENLYDWKHIERWMDAELAQELMKDIGVLIEMVQED